MNLKSSRIWFDYMLLCPVSIFSNLVCISLRPHLSSSGGSVGLFEHISILWSSLSLLEALHKPEKKKKKFNITEKSDPVLSINRAFHMYDISPPTHAHPQSHQDQTHSHAQAHRTKIKFFTWTSRNIPNCNGCRRTPRITYCSIIFMFNIHCQHPWPNSDILIAKHSQTENKKIQSVKTDYKRGKKNFNKNFQWHV